MHSVLHSMLPVKWYSVSWVSFSHSFCSVSWRALFLSPCLVNCSKRVMSTENIRTVEPWYYISYYDIRLTSFSSTCVKLIVELCLFHLLAFGAVFFSNCFESNELWDNVFFFSPFVSSHLWSFEHHSGDRSAHWDSHHSHCSIDCWWNMNHPATT